MLGEWNVIGSSRTAIAEASSSIRRVASSSGMTFAGVTELPMVMF